MRLALADERVHRLDLDVEQRLDGRLDLRLGRVARTLNTTLFCSDAMRRLFGDDRRDDHVVVARQRSLGSFEPRLQRIDRRLGQHELVAAENVVDVDALDRQHVDLRNVARGARKLALASAPSTISAFVEAELGERLAQSALVLRLGDLGIGPDDDPPSLAFADSACLSASARTFFGRSWAWLRTTGPKARPPPRNCGTRAEP